jgi:hypothetical protein
MKEYSQWPTFPQVYIDGDFFGGADIMIAGGGGAAAGRGRLQRVMPLSVQRACGQQASSALVSLGGRDITALPRSSLPAAAYTSGELAETLEAALNS